MEIYNYLQKFYKFELNKQYELTEIIKNDICKTFNITIDKLGKDFHQKVQEKFLALAKKNSRIKIIDGHKNPSQVFAEILSHLQ